MIGKIYIIKQETHTYKIKKYCQKKEEHITNISKQQQYYIPFYLSISLIRS